MSTDEDKARIKSDEARGYELAASMLQEHQAQRNIWLRYVAKLIPLNVTARGAFMAFINRHVKDMQAHVKVKMAEQDPEHGIYAKTARSAVTMLTNMRTIAKAMNAGFVVPVHMDGMTPRHDSRGDLMPVNPFDWTLTQARAYLETHAADGTAKAKRGRPATPFLDKLKKFMDDNAGDDAAKLKQAFEFIEARVQRKEYKEANAAK